MARVRLRFGTVGQRAGAVIHVSDEAAAELVANRQATRVPDDAPVSEVEPEVEDDDPAGESDED